MARKPFPQPWFRKQTGTWYLEVGGKQVSLGKDREAAFRQYHVLMAKHRPGALPSVPGDSPPVVTIFSRFESWLTANRSPGTLEAYHRRLQSFVSSLADKTLLVADLRPHHVQTWVDGHPNWSPGMKRGRMMAVQTALNWAAEQGIIDRSPIAKIKKPKQGRRENPLTVAQFHALLKAVGFAPFRDLLEVTWETGARPQESTRVEARHFDATGKRWVFPEGEAKGKRKTRIVFLTDKAAKICARLAKKHPEGPLFRNARGKQWRPFAINSQFCRAAAKLGKKYALVDLRHSFATRLLKSGVDALTVATLMGHADTSMLAKHYAHLHQDAKHLHDALRKGG